MRRFWLAFLVSFGSLGAIVILTTDIVPVGWQIPGIDWAVIFPLAIISGSHILFPIVLNPWLLMFSY